MADVLGQVRLGFGSERRDLAVDLLVLSFQG
jgi:hypothetical protein